MRSDAFRSTLLALALLAMAVDASPAAAECSPSDLATARQSYDTAYAFVQAGKWASAVSPLLTGVAKCPEHWESRELLAQAYMRTKQYENAANHYAALVDGKYGGNFAATEERVLSGYGYALLKTEDYTTAEAMYAGWHAKDAENTEPLQRLVFISEVIKDYDKAIDYEKKLFATDPENFEYARKIGDLYKKNGDNASATTWYSMAGSAGVETAGSYDVGRDHMKAKRYSEAAASFQDYLKTKPESSAAWQNLGVCYDKMSQKDKAVESFEQALKLAPEKHDLASSLGFLYMDVGRVSDAQSMAQAAIDGWPKDDPKLKGMYYLMGKVREEQERYREAIDFFDVAVDDPFWGQYAEGQIQRQRDLIAREKALKEAGGSR